MKPSTTVIGTAWYRNVWPWFIVVLLAVSVVASLATVVIAFRHRDIDVRELPIEQNEPVSTALPPNRESEI